MKIGVIGSGRIGANAALLFAKAGHQVAISNSRGPQSLTELIQQIGPNVKAMTADEAVSFGEVILLALPWFQREGLPATAHFAQKIVIDAMNAYLVNDIRSGQVLPSDVSTCPPM